jgi:hypothetical protein
MTVLSCTDASVFATTTVEVASELSNATTPSATATYASFAPSWGIETDSKLPFSEAKVTGRLALPGIVTDCPLVALTVSD